MILKHHISLENMVRFAEVFILLMLTVGPVPPVALVFGYFALWLFNYEFWDVYRRWILFDVILILSMIIPIIVDIVNVNETTKYAYSGMAFVLPFLLSRLYVVKYRFFDYISMLEKVCFFCSVISIIGMMFVYLFPEVVFSFLKIVYYGRPVYTVGFFGAIQNDVDGGLLLRSCGMAFEPGAFQIVCNLGLAIFFEKERPMSSRLFGFDEVRNWTRIIIYIFAVLLTKSTTGVIVLILVCGIYLIRYPRALKVMLFVAVPLGSIFYNTILEQLGKLAPGSLGNISLRMSGSLYVLKNYWMCFLGIGSTQYTKQYKVDGRIISYDIYTNLYLRFGMVLVAILLFLLFRLLRLSTLLCVVVALSLMTESVLGPVVVVLLFYSKTEPRKLRCMLDERFRMENCYEKSSRVSSKRINRWSRSKPRSYIEKY